MAGNIHYYQTCFNYIIITRAYIYKTHLFKCRILYKTAKYLKLIIEQLRKTSNTLRFIYTTLSPMTQKCIVSLQNFF